MVKITIIAEGDPATGKSLAISDMMQVFYDSPHFLNHPSNKTITEHVGKEICTFVLQLRSYSND